MDPMAAIRETFFQECEEGLGDLETGLLQMEAGDTGLETVNSVFRAVHSIKGGAGAFGLDALVRFAHAFETTLDGVRAGRLNPDAALVAVMLRANDILADLVTAARDGVEFSEESVQASVTELHVASGKLEPGSDAADDDGMGDFTFTPLLVDDAVPDPAQRDWIIRFVPNASLYVNANDPLLLFRELANLGVLQVTLDASAVPQLDALDPEGAYLAWSLELATSATEAAIREVFDFVEGDCSLDISPKADAVSEEAASGTSEADIMALIASVTATAPSFSREPEPAPASLPDVALAAEAKAAASGDGVIAAKSARKPEPQAAGPTPTIRVDLDRVDRMIDLVGELVINQAMLSQRISEAGLARASAAMTALDELENLTRNLQDSVMAIRAQPVKSVFQRMPRLVRETAALVNKHVRLVTEGENTEVDKTVIERLSEPLTHMIRNSIDHGIETPEVRLAAGKAAEGVVLLSARHRSGRIVLEIADDGAGINRARVRQIAVEKGLISPEATLSDEETDNLIFMAGFSTAATVSDISGRGVGMDVVRRAIQALGGRITIVSRPGQGSTFTLSLPLTLAVLDGMVVSVNNQTLVAPLTAMVETLQPKPGEVYSLGEGYVMKIRGAYLPLIDVGAALGYRRTPLDPSEGVALLVETEGGARSALLVDAIQGQRQVVIKSLEANFQHVPGIAAATILGDGRVALILDIDAVVARGSNRDTALTPPPSPSPSLALAG